MIEFNTIAKNVLSREQQELLPLLEDFSHTHFLIWGTAISLQLGHRKSIDFDFINNLSQGTLLEFKKRVESHNIYLERAELERFAGAENIKQDEFHFTINSVHFSCFNYYRTLYDDQKIQIYSDLILFWGLKTLSLKQLLCTKLFACITRNKWKDAVDIYFILNHLEITLNQALTLCEEKYFINIFNRNYVLEQLVSWNWDTTESVEYLIKNPPKDEEVISFLQNQAQELISKASKNS